MLKRVLFLIAIGMLLLVTAPGCAPAGDDGSNAGRIPAVTTSNVVHIEKAVITSFAAVSQTVKEFQAPQLVYVVGYARNITITQNGIVIKTETIPTDGKGVYPAIFKGSTSGRPATLVNKGNPVTETFTLTVSNGISTATANCSVTVVAAPPTESVK